jgi:hydrogenase nickel incorporation protein HypB
MSEVATTILRDVREQRRIEAGLFQKTLTDHGVFCVNMISSPGAGKTSILEAMAKHWNGRFRFAVLVGDIATDRDAQRLARWTEVRQLTTGGACHLELPLVQSGWAQLDPAGLQFLIIENVGNLVCPASYELGEHLRTVVLSVTEGDDKPGKYPKAFRTSHACIINKIDLLPYVPFSLDAVTLDARRIQNKLPLMTTSATSGHGSAEWCQYLVEQRNRQFGLSDQ